MMEGHKFLVTGGAGFIGSHLVEKLLEMDNEVVILDNFSVGNNDNLARVFNSPGLKVVRGDVRDASTVDSVVKEADYVFHLAVQCLGVSLVDPMIVHEVNTTGTLNVCMACLKHDSKGLVHVSSSEVYGTAQYVPMDESHPLSPTTPYGASKVAAETYVRTFYNTWNLPTIIVRPFNTYGERCRVGLYGAVIPNFVTRLFEGQPPAIHGDGDQTRDFTYVSDTVDGIIKAAECEKLVGDVVNIARGEEVSINKIAEIVLDLTGMSGKIAPVHEKERPGDVRRHLADISKARKMIGFTPKFSIEEGIKRYIEARAPASTQHQIM